MIKTLEKIFEQVSALPEADKENITETLTNIMRLSDAKNEEEIPKILGRINHYLTAIVKPTSQTEQIMSRTKKSKWARVARRAHTESPLKGLANRVIADSREFRDTFTFRHDQE